MAFHINAKMEGRIYSVIKDKLLTVRFELGCDEWEWQYRYAWDQADCDIYNALRSRLYHRKTFPKIVLEDDPAGYARRLQKRFPSHIELK